MTHPVDTSASSLTHDGLVYSGHGGWDEAQQQGLGLSKADRGTVTAERLRCQQRTPKLNLDVAPSLS